MLRISKLFLILVLLFLASVTVPPIGLLFILSLASNHRPKSKFAFRAHLREIREKQNCGSLDRLRFWFRRQIRPHLRTSERIIWQYYRRPRTILLVSACGIAISWALFLLISHVNEETTSDYLSYGLWQVVITGFLAVSICALAWVLFSVEIAFRSVFVTLVISAIVSVCVVGARLLAIDFFSKVFPFPPTYAPVAFGIATTLLSASFTSIVFALLALFFEIYFLLVLGSNFKKNRLSTIVLVISSVLGLLGAWFATYAMFDASYPKGQLLIVKLAENYDFTSNHMCDAGRDERVLFIDNVADRAIAAKFPKVGPMAPKKLAEDDVAKYMPTNFHTVRCNPIDSPLGNASWCNKRSRSGDCQS